MSDPVRRLSGQETAFYTEHGWLHAPALVEPGLIERMARKARELHSVLRDGASREGASGTVSVSAVAQAFGQNRGLAEADEDFAAPVFSPVMAGNAARLLPGEPDVRLQINNLLVKEPVGGAHGPTTFHQDFPWFPMDRSSMLTVWLALVDIPAGMGSLRFYDRSHLYGSLGRSFARDGDDAISQHPWIADLELSPPLDLKAGDATVHSALTIHGAAPNAYGTPRLSFAWTYFDAGTLYTGSPFKQTDDLGLRVNEVFDHPAFPIVPRS
ncbi:phytanoyl-CoA dioxygenase family protein [Planotetraspora sp. A-T 1434]|uniref:phytanoyl-CoA dioxygenase family protein n=1 Tax=Planotetraspora sp. A-T 1434 TaxID=2979219 RepID=UPI0021BFB635|nr:phytanoyl-CoA dioxygenase family protein [Planotetraspora sp. A-T 1434]MCT9933126.1 phytanoyl-CoA dioxygenase family protein [Planotetraspora sp. A-T 1434]